MIVRLALATHLVGAILWIGGTLAAAWVAAFAARATPPVADALAGARRALRTFATPGMLLAWVGGLGMLIPSFTTLYARAGWMHTKLLLLVVASALHGVLSARIRKAADGSKPATAGLLQGLALGLLACALGVVFLAVLKPGG